MKLPGIFENRSTILPLLDPFPLVEPENDVANCIESEVEGDEHDCNY